MARGRHYAKLPLSNAARLSFSDLCIFLFLFLSLCRLCVCVFLCSHWSLVYVPLIFFCPADHVPDWQPRVLLGMVEARSVNVKKTTTTTTWAKSTLYCHVFSVLAFTSVSYRACVVFGPLFYATQAKYIFIFLCFSHLSHTPHELLKKKRKLPCAKEHYLGCPGGPSSTARSLEALDLD